MRIAVYGIAKNEASFVASWAESAADADVRILVDTGSTDDTVSLAKGAGVTVATKSFTPWRFDTARNYSLSLVPEDVDLCISLDLDEVLIPGWREALERSFDPTVTRYRYLYTWSWNDDGSPGLQYGGDKIHVRHGYQWRYPVHEVLVNDIAEVQGWTELEIHHHRDQEKDRGQYLPLLELAVAEDPDNDRNTHYLGREYMYHERFEEAARELKRHLELPTATWDAERSQSMRYLATCEPERAEFWLHEAIRAAPSRREGWVDLAFLLMKEQRWQECLDACREGLALDRRPLEYITEAHAWGPRLDDMAANAAYRLQNWPAAVDHGQRALALEPSNARLQENLAHYRRAAAAWGSAVVESDGRTLWRKLPTIRCHEVTAPGDLPAGWSLMNPSVATDGLRLLMVVRSVNYTVTASGYDMSEDSVVRSRSALVDVGRNGEFDNWRWIDDDAARDRNPQFPVHGVEDMRLFARGGEWWILGGIRDYATSGAIRQVLARLDDGGSPRLMNPWRVPSPLTPDENEPVYEKNWVAVAHQHDDLDVVWSTDPLVTLRIDPIARQVAPIHGRASRLASHELRGGSPTFTTPRGPVYVVHRVGPNLDHHERPYRTYLHAFVTMCADHVHIGPEWVIEDLGLEYVAGAAYMDGRIYLSYGVDDCHARLAICGWPELSHVIPNSCDAGPQVPADSATVTR